MTPSALEVLANLALGAEPAAAGLPPARGVGWRAALDDVIVEALAHPPCLVSFSGGRDSSAILAAAVDVARREGLDEPVPAILRFAGMPHTDETSWQELMLSHAGVRERIVIEISTELDALGHIATTVLGDLGVHWPGNAYMHVPLFEQARGGSVLTGVGGDELFETRGSRFVLVAHRHERPQPRDLGALALATLPRSLRATIRRRRHATWRPWLTAAGNGTVDRALAVDEVAWPHRWDRTVRYWARTRSYLGVRGTLGRVAGPFSVNVTSPFIEPTVLAELAPVGGPTGFASRNAAMTELMGELMPAAVRARETKAVFAAPIWGPAMRAFAASWNGAGVDTAYVDVEGLRREWLTDEPDFRTILLLHTAWLAAQRRSGDQASASSS